MAITYKGVPNRERWLAPEDKFKSKGIIEVGETQTFTIPPYKVELELVIDVEEPAVEVVEEVVERITETSEEIIIPKKRKHKSKVEDVVGETEVEIEQEEVEAEIPRVELGEEDEMFRAPYGK